MAFMRRGCGVLWVAVLIALCMATGANAGQPTRPRPGVARNAWDTDVAAKQALDRDGQVREGKHVVLWFPADSLSDEAAKSIVQRLDRGVHAAKRFIGREDWQVEGDRRVHFYCPSGQFISHAPGGNCAFIPLWRMRDDESPWLHEAMHLLLASPRGSWIAVGDSVARKRVPLWLLEGLADALAMDICEREKLVYYSPLFDVQPSGLDSLAAEVLRRAPSDSVVMMIGARGKLPQLFGPHRFEYAVPFYAGSVSFTRFIVRRHGYGPLLRAVEDFGQEHETLARETGEPIEQLKSEWLAGIGLEPPAH